MGRPHRPAAGRVGRPRGGHAAPALDRVEQGGLLAADERPGALDEAQIEVESRTRHTPVQDQPALAGLFQRRRAAAAPPGGTRPACREARPALPPRRPAMAMPSITAWGSPSIMLRSMNAPGSPSSPLQTTNFRSSRAAGDQLPLHTRGEAGAAASLQPGALDLVDHLRGPHLAQRPRESLVAAALAGSRRCIPGRSRRSAAARAGPACRRTGVPVSGPRSRSITWPPRTVRSTISQASSFRTRQ